MMSLHRSRGALRRMLITAAPLLALAGGAGPCWSQAEGTGMPAAAKLKTSSGEEVFRHICQGCHMPDAKGATGAGKYPALAGDTALASTEFMAITLLQGRRNMPAFGGNGNSGLFFALPTLNDEQIAAVINYVRSSFGNHFKGRITAAAVKALRRPNNDKLVPAH